MTPTAVETIFGLLFVGILAFIWRDIRGMKKESLDEIEKCKTSCKEKISAMQEEINDRRKDCDIKFARQKETELVLANLRSELTRSIDIIHTRQEEGFKRLEEKITELQGSVRNGLQTTFANIEKEISSIKSDIHSLRRYRDN